MTTVLGTPVVAGRATDKALLLSDLHVPFGGGKVVDTLNAAMAAARAEGAALFVLGDLFDSYVSAAQVHHGVFREVADRFAALVAAGTPVTVLVGNRDFLMGPEFANRSRALLVPGGIRLALGGVDTLLLHGDELCLNDLPYQRSKRVLRHPVTRAVARNLPVALALRVAKNLRNRSKRSIASGDQSRFVPPRAAIEAAFATGARRLVFGHIHRHAHGHLAGGEYRVLPAFDAGGGAILVDDAGWRPMRVTLGGALEPVAEPPPAPWT